MIKNVALIKRKAGLSREEFARHYEENHAPLVLRTLPGIRRYVRNFVTPTPGYSPEDSIGFDCVTEIWFDDEGSARHANEVMASAMGDVIRQDEENFIDQDRMVFFRVEVCESEGGST